MTLEKLREFINQARPGKSFVYGQSSYEKVPDRDIMTVAYNAYKAGKVVLLQKRTGDRKKEDGKFDYIAVKK